MKKMSSINKRGQWQNNNNIKRWWIVGGKGDDETKITINNNE
jgi:hypothetical protein